MRYGRSVEHATHKITATSYCHLSEKYSMSLLWHRHTTQAQWMKMKLSSIAKKERERIFALDTQQRTHVGQSTHTGKCGSRYTRLVGPHSERPHMHRRTELNWTDGHSLSSSAQSCMHGRITHTAGGRKNDHWQATKLEQGMQRWSSVRSAYWRFYLSCSSCCLGFSSVFMFSNTYYSFSWFSRQTHTHSFCAYQRICWDARPYHHNDLHMNMSLLVLLLLALCVYVTGGSPFASFFHETCAACA